MPLTWFCVWQASGDAPVPLSPGEYQSLQALLRGCPGLQVGHVLTPTTAHDPHHAEAKGSPSLILQLTFGDVMALEHALQAGGPLACLAAPAFLPGLTGAQRSQQAMLVRRYPVPDDPLRIAEGNALTYWVEYAGPALDENAWHAHYVAHHVPLLVQLPGIRGVEVYTPAVAICGLGLPLRGCLQRNKAVFDSAQAMNVAMQSPVRDALRRDFQAMPPYEGAALHFPFATITIDRAADRSSPCRPVPHSPR